MKYDFVVVGAGISGCTAAQRLAEKGLNVLVVEKKDHIGGCCADKNDENGILIQPYGPHIFHTKHKEIFEYLKRFANFSGYKHKVLSKHNGELYPIPINLTTFNKFFKKNLDSEGMKAYLEKTCPKIEKIKNSRDVAVSRVGEELYEAFIRHYTKKQWDHFPEELDKEVLERLPVRFDEDDYYFSGQEQGMPVGGFSEMFKKMIEHPNITLMLNTDYKKIPKDIEFSKMICTAPIDEFFGFKLGKLQYRSLKFVFETHDKEVYQENSVINHPDPEVPYSRVTEFKLLTGQKNSKTTILREIFTWGGEPMYPVPKKETKELYLKYKELADKQENVYFLGRLGRYRYINMDDACREAIELVNEIINSQK